jgi:hypothetical protein
MDKNKFWLGGRLFNTAPPRLGAPTQCKARPQDGRPNATQDTSKLGKLHGKLGPNATQGHVRKLGNPNARPQRKRKARPHVCNLGAPTQRKARPQDGRPNAKLIRNEKRPHKGALG